MSHFPSWFETKNFVIFLDDQEALKVKRKEGRALINSTTHSHLMNNFLNGYIEYNKGLTSAQKQRLKKEMDYYSLYYSCRNKEGFPCHPHIAKLIRQGKMNKLMKASEIKVSVNSKGQLHGICIDLVTYARALFKNGKFVKMKPYKEYPKAKFSSYNLVYNHIPLKYRR